MICEQALDANDRVVVRFGIHYNTSFLDRLCKGQSADTRVADSDEFDVERGPESPPGQSCLIVR